MTVEGGCTMVLSRDLATNNSDVMRRYPLGSKGYHVKENKPTSGDLHQYVILVELLKTTDSVCTISNPIRNSM